VYPSARHLPSVGLGAGHALLGWWWPGNPWTRAYRQDRAEPVERTAGWLSGSCLLLRRAAFDAVHGFDPEYFMYFEDVDLGERLGRAGWTSVYCPSARVVHIGGHSTERTPDVMARAHHRSAYRYLSRRYPARWQAPLRWVLGVGLAVRAQLSLRSARVAGGAAIPERRVD
jgi:N-acetylglucosaminyl-diphospho-decaprenol L-rhamnosyltransferase